MGPTRAILDPENVNLLVLVNYLVSHIVLICNPVVYGIPDEGIRTGTVYILSASFALDTIILNTDGPQQLSAPSPESSLPSIIITD